MALFVSERCEYMNFSAFPQYTKFSPKVPVCCVTPNHPGAIHYFFDTSPISPDNRYLVASILPYEDHLNEPGDSADILLVDLDTGEEKIIASTKGWGLQVGAHAQWCGNRTICYNDLDTDTWEPYVVKLNIMTGEKQHLNSKGIDMLSPDHKFAITHNLVNGRFHQWGYGVMVPDDKMVRNGNYPTDDGFYLTNLETGECKMLVSFAQLIDAAIENPDEFKDGQFYGWMPKWSPDGKKIMYIVRWVSNGDLPRRNMLFTSDADGSNIKLALHYREWAKWGHHVNWHPDSKHITMNLRHNSDHIKFVSFCWDGSDLRPIMDDIWGSGHPTISKDGSHILTDSYFTLDSKVYDDGSVPIRWIDIEKHTETEIIRIMTKTELEENFRLDPHPAWSYDWRYVAFNGYDGKQRKVYVCDMSALTD